MSRNIVALTLALAIPVPFHGQQPSHEVYAASEKHGTCSVTAIAPFGMAFTVDSRITWTDSVGRVTHVPGCKVLLARPTILLVSVGLVDHTNAVADHWRSLEAASKTLMNLPKDPSEASLNQWGFTWADTLIRHYREAGQTPSASGELADILLITRVGSKPYYKRIHVNWDGNKFQKWIEGQPIDASVPQLHYAGACRYFFKTSDEYGNLVPGVVPFDTAENARNKLWGDRKLAAKSTDDLADAVYGLEALSADIDGRVNGDKAVIARPFAAAQWGEGQTGWQIDFNPECAAPAKQEP